MGQLGTVSLEVVVAKFSSRVSRLPVAYQQIFCEDLETSLSNRLRILERTA